MRGRAACTLAVVTALHQGDIHALQRKVAERSHTVNTTTDHQYFGVRTAAQVVD
ncbi:hypothetical protein J2X98_001426 [Pseudarthrobacter enclensis]|uniref:Uncharacterized protein n=1 Tax=Pseudarthrobacter enclensis TaxID=993070 RepID=A0ABT9RS14_9MICC|nr:hypothetical protein [Pseudarthrobacter enclensis]